MKRRPKLATLTWSPSAIASLIRFKHQPEVYLSCDESGLTYSGHRSPIHPPGTTEKAFLHKR